MTTLLFAFVALKLLGVLSLSWVWVLAPLWVPVIGVSIGMTVRYLNTPVNE